MDDIESIIQSMIDAGEPEEKIEEVVRLYKESQIETTVDPVVEPYAGPRDYGFGGGFVGEDQEMLTSLETPTLPKVETPTAESSWGDKISNVFNAYVNPLTPMAERPLYAVGIDIGEIKEEGRKKSEGYKSDKINFEKIDQTYILDCLSKNCWRIIAAAI